MKQGVVVVLETLRVLAEAGFKPANTLEFHFYSGEEGGLLGSRDVFNSYVRNGVDVLAVMNQDMTGFSPNNVIAVFTDYGDSSLIAFLKKLVPVYSKLPLSTDYCGYACSDQYVLVSTCVSGSAGNRRKLTGHHPALLLTLRVILPCTSVTKTLPTRHLISTRLRTLSRRLTLHMFTNTPR